MQVRGDIIVRGDVRGINFTDGVTNFPKQPKLTFDIGGFYLTSTSDGSPLVNARGIVFTDGISTYTNPVRVGFSSNFYLSGNSNVATTVNLRNSIVKSIALEFPGSSENILIFRAQEAMRLTNVRAALVGSSSPSVTFVVKSGSDRSNLTTTHTTSTTVTNTTTGTNIAISTPTIPAGSWVCLITTAQSGTVSEMDVNLQLEFV